MAHLYLLSLSERLGPQLLRLAVNYLAAGVAAVAVAHWLNARYGLPVWVPLAVALLPALLFADDLMATLLSMGPYRFWEWPWPVPVGIGLLATLALTVWTGSRAYLPYWACPAIVAGIPALVHLSVALQPWGFNNPFRNKAALFWLGVTTAVPLAAVATALYVLLRYPLWCLAPITLAIVILTAVLMRQQPDSIF